jgi:hypothetical protein
MLALLYLSAEGMSWHDDLKSDLESLEQELVLQFRKGCFACGVILQILTHIILI